MDIDYAEMKKSMVRSFGKIRESMDRLGKRIAGGICTASTDSFTESLHDMVDFALLRMTMETFMKAVESTVAEGELNSAKSLRDLEFGGDTDGDDISEVKEFSDMLNRIFGEGKDGDADA